MYIVNALDGVSKIGVLSWKLNRSARLVSSVILQLSLFFLVKIYFFVHRTNGTTRSDVEQLHSIKVCNNAFKRGMFRKNAWNGIILFSHIQFIVFKEGNVKAKTV